MLVIMDVLFFIFVPGSWMTYQENNSVWNGLRGMHGFAIFLSVITFILKVYTLLIIHRFHYCTLFSSTISNCPSDLREGGEDDCCMNAFLFLLYYIICIVFLPVFVYSMDILYYINKYKYKVDLYT